MQTDRLEERRTKLTKMKLLKVTLRHYDSHNNQLAQQTMSQLTRQTMSPLTRQTMSQLTRQMTSQLTRLKRQVNLHDLNGKSTYTT